MLERPRFRDTRFTSAFTRGLGASLISLGTCLAAALALPAQTAQAAAQAWAPLASPVAAPALTPSTRPRPTPSCRPRALATCCATAR